MNLVSSWFCVYGVISDVYICDIAFVSFKQQRENILFFSARIIKNVYVGDLLQYAEKDGTHLLEHWSQYQ